MTTSQNSGVFYTNTQKMLLCMIILLFSIIIHYFLNNNYYNISTDIEKCPFCYGNNLCATFDNNEITFTNLTISDKFSNIINMKNVYIANYNGSKIVLKKLGHNWELAVMDNQICEGQIIKESCPPYSESFEKDFTANIFEFLMNDDKKIPLNFKLCSTTTIHYFINHLFSLYTHLNTSVMTANIWTTLLANVEPLMLQLFLDQLIVLDQFDEKAQLGVKRRLDLKTADCDLPIFYFHPNYIVILQLLSSKDNWPVPIYYGACGRIIVEEYCGKSLHSVVNEPWILRANLAVQLLQAADDFTNKHPIFRFYLTDISSDNIVVTDDNKIKFIDLENIIISEKLSQSEDFRPHESQYFDDCYAFSPDEICAHSISDHNFYSICKLLLSKSAPWPMMGNGLLHSPPDNILEKHPEIFDYIQFCAQSSENINRFEASRKLINTLKQLL